MMKLKSIQIWTIYSILFFAIVACGPEAGILKTYRYTIRNESGVKMRIIGYLQYNEVPYIINLENGEERTQTYKDGLPPRGYSWNFFYGSSNGEFYADSLKVIYNNVKYKDFSYKNVDDNRNPLYYYNNVITEGSFTFLKEDYQDAEDCNGNCD
ncbi:MAG: hypothetical protein L3J45_08025 [Flavobacteriaceae bacterium]|nr:hypothetical protein [Flavobacteriaceae bacterium]